MYVNVILEKKKDKIYEINYKNNSFSYKIYIFFFFYKIKYITETLKKFNCKFKSTVIIIVFQKKEKKKRTKYMKYIMKIISSPTRFTFFFHKITYITESKFF